MSVHSISQVMRLACVIFKRNFTLDYIDNVHSCKIEKAEQFCSAFVGVAGFEPAASCSQSRRDNRATLHPESGGKYRTIFVLNNTISEIRSKFIWLRKRYGNRTSDRVSNVNLASPDGSEKLRSTTSFFS